MASRARSRSSRLRTSFCSRGEAVFEILNAAGTRSLSQLIAATGVELEQLGTEEVAEGLTRTAVSAAMAVRSEGLAEAGEELAARGAAQLATAAAAADVARAATAVGVADVAEGAAEIGAAETLADAAEQDKEQEK